ncbi:MAG: hypothetical protein ACTS3R_03890 [Inquilinaceae bacterium]
MNRLYEDQALRHVTAILEEAEQGDPKLDRLLAHMLSMEPSPTDERIDMLLEGGVSWDTLAPLTQGEAPAFTTSLDASLPGENIVFTMHSSQRGRWAALQKQSDGGEIAAWGANEALARRIAALKGLQGMSMIARYQVLERWRSGVAPGAAEPIASSERQDLSLGLPGERWRILF